MTRYETGIRGTELRTDGPNVYHYTRPTIALRTICGAMAHGITSLVVADSQVADGAAEYCQECTDALRKDDER